MNTISTASSIMRARDTVGGIGGAGVVPVEARAEAATRHAAAVNQGGPTITPLYPHPQWWITQFMYQIVFADEQEGGIKPFEFGEL